LGFTCANTKSAGLFLAALEFRWLKSRNFDEKKRFENMDNFKVPSGICRTSAILRNINKKASVKKRWLLQLNQNELIKH